MNLASIKSFIKQYPFSMGCFALSFCLFVVGYINSVSIPDLDAEYVELNRKRQILDFNINNNFELESHIKIASELDEIIRKRMINPSERADNFRYLFGLEQNAGVKIESPKQLKTNPFDEKSKNDTAITYYELNATGHYDQLLKFVYELQNGYFLGKITKLRLEQSKRLDPDLLTLNLEIGFFGVNDK